MTELIFYKINHLMRIDISRIQHFEFGQYNIAIFLMFLQSTVIINISKNEGHQTGCFSK
jgi:hypothetical protein